MKDQITLKRIEMLHPDVVYEAKEIYKEICERLTGKAVCRFAFTLRTMEEQDALYAQGRTKPGKIVTKARGGQSWHNYGLAIDIVLLIDKDGNGTYETASWETNKDFDGDGIHDWEEIVFVFKMYGWEWGGDWPNFKDMPHFQKTYGMTIAQAKRKYEAHIFYPGTNYINV